MSRAIALPNAIGLLRNLVIELFQEQPVKSATAIDTNSNQQTVANKAANH